MFPNIFRVLTNTEVMRNRKREWVMRTSDFVKNVVPSERNVPLPDCRRWREIWSSNNHTSIGVERITGSPFENLNNPPPRVTILPDMFHVPTPNWVCFWLGFLALCLVFVFPATAAAASPATSPDLAPVPVTASRGILHYHRKTIACWHLALSWKNAREPKRSV